MSLTLKLSSLAIRTLSKPIANQIKAQAREHERFRRICIGMAQSLHRLDMRLRLGTLRDNAASQRQAAAEAELRKHKPTSPTAKTHAEARAEEEAVAKAKAAAEEAANPRKPHIRPLSESKAIESGATFISESFLFLVAGGLIVFESWRSRRKETTRREDVESRLAELEQSEKAARQALVALEKELLQQRAKQGVLSKSTPRILPREVWEVEKQEEVEEAEEPSWWSRVTSYFTFGQSAEQSAESVVHQDQANKTDDKTPVPTNPASQDSSLKSKGA